MCDIIFSIKNLVLIGEIMMVLGRAVACLVGLIFTANAFSAELLPIPDRLVVLSFDDANKSDRTFVADVLKEQVEVSEVERICRETLEVGRCSVWRNTRRSFRPAAPREARRSPVGFGGPAATSASYTPEQRRDASRKTEGKQRHKIRRHCNCAGLTC